MKMNLLSNFALALVFVFMLLICMSILACVGIFSGSGKSVATMKMIKLGPVAAEYDSADAAVAKVAAYLRSLNLHNPGAYGVVFDIDDTLVGCSVASSVRQLWRVCEELGLQRHVVTARPDMSLPLPADQAVVVPNTNRAITVAELQGHGLGSFSTLWLMPMEDLTLYGPNPSLYKHRVRQKLVEAMGHPLILNVGDQWTDMGRMSLETMAQYSKQHADTKAHLCVLDDTYIVGLKLPTK